MLVLGLVELPWWAILLLLLVAFYMYETRHWNFFKKQGIPCLKPIPIMGTMMHYYNDLPKEDCEVYMKFRDNGVYGDFLGDRPTLMVCDEKFLADVLIKESATFTNRLTITDPGSMSDKMLVNMKDARWKSVRHDMTPTFTTGKLKMMHSEVNRCAKAFGEYLLERARARNPIDVKDYTGGFTMDVISSTAFGMNVDSLKDKDSLFVKHAKAIFAFDLENFKMFLAMYFPVVTALLRKVGFSVELAPKESVDFFVNVSKQAVQMRKSGKDQSRTDFLQLMINAQGEDIQNDDKRASSESKALSTDEILANAMLFFAAGYDTTANTLSFLMYSLATNPDVQAKLIAEIDQVTQDMDYVDYSKLAEMPYLEQCIAETLRIYPVIMRISRVANRDITMHGVFIPKDMLVQVPVLAIHKDPKIWPDPERFDPERFSAENKKNRSPYHYMPFGAGQRGCIGTRLAQLELKVAVVHMLKRVTIETSEKTEIPVKFAKTALLRPDNLWLKVVPRY